MIAVTNIDQLLQVIVRSTARHTGMDFLELLARELAESLEVFCAFISEVVDPEVTRVRVVAMWIDGRPGESFEYSLTDTPCAEVFATGLSLIESAVQARFPHDAWLREQGIESYLALPFFNAAGNPLGHLGVVSRQPLYTSALVEALLHMFACRVGAEIERMHMQKAMDIRDRQMAILVQANKKLNSDLAVPKVMRELVQAAMRLSDTVAGSWGILENGAMVFREYYRGTSVVPIDYAFEAGIGVPGHVMVTHVPYIANDAANDPYVLSSLQQSLQFENLAHVPVMDRDGVLLGCLEIHNKRDPKGFNQQDLDWLESLASDAAIALENARLFEDAGREHDELERRVAERTAALVLANEELQAFSYSVSHDLRAPLRGILGFSDALLEDCAEQINSQCRDYVARIARGAQNMDDMIKGLLEFSRALHTELRRTRVDLGAMAREILDQLVARHPDAATRFQIAPELIASGDPVLLRVVLTNLLHNAWKFSAGAASPRIEFGSTAQGGETVFHVCDNGVGFDQAYVERVFQPFQRLHSVEQFEGTGIGLATVRRIVERHGGKVWASAVPGQGATFYFTLPD